MFCIRLRKFVYVHVIYTMIFYVEPFSAHYTQIMDESDATIEVYKEKVQQLMSENQTLRSQLALPAPVKTEAPFSKINILVQCCMFNLPL